MSDKLIVLLLFIAVMCLIYLYYSLEEHISTLEDQAHNALQDWREANPEYYIGDWPYAQQLVLNQLVALEICFAFNIYPRNESRIHRLLSLLNESRPPSSPRPRRKRSSQFNSQTTVFFLSKNPD